MPDAQTIGEVKIRTILDEQGDLAYAWVFSGVNDMELIGLLAVPLVKHLLRMAGIVPFKDDDPEEP